MSRKILVAAAALMLSAPMAFAQDTDTAMADAAMLAPTGDIAAGEAAFRQCIACHVVVNEAGDTLAGRNARTGPNLYGIAGGVYGDIEDFRWSPGMQALNEMGDIMTEESFVAYVQDPTGYIRETTGDNSIRGAMTYQVRSEDDAVNLYAYLYSLAPPAEGAEAVSN
jgi:cytochrome c